MNNYKIKYQNSYNNKYNQIIKIIIYKMIMINKFKINKNQMS